MPTSQSTMNISTPTPSKHRTRATPSVDRWFDNFNSLSKFMRENSKRPCRHSEDPDEQSIGCWLANQQQDFKWKEGCMRNQDGTRHSYWLAFTQNPRFRPYLVDYEEIWLKNLKIAKKFIRKNCRLPVPDSADPLEKNIRRWMDKQHKDMKRRRNMMRFSHIAGKWNSFMDENMCYSISLTVLIRRRGVYIINDW
jgi:hypothetical protein